MPFLPIALFLLAGVAPEPPTAWMEPARLGISIGMERDRVVAALEQKGRDTAPGKEPEHLIVRLSDSRTVTLAFERNRLASIRFELSDFIPAIRAAFTEIEARLRERHGEPTRKIDRPPALVFDAPDPRIYVVASFEHRGAFGSKGLGFLVVRYFAPPPAAN